MNLMSLMNLSCICQGNNELINLGPMQDEDKDKDKDGDKDKDEDEDFWQRFHEDFWQRSRNEAKKLLEAPSRDAYSGICTDEDFFLESDSD